MHGLALFYAHHPFWVWMALAALMLAAEIATGYGYLFCPAGAAALVALAALLKLLGLSTQMVIFALIAVGAVAARFWLIRRAHRPAPGKTGEPGS